MGGLIGRAAARAIREGRSPAIVNGPAQDLAATCRERCAELGLECDAQGVPVVKLGRHRHPRALADKLWATLQGSATAGRSSPL